MKLVEILQAFFMKNFVKIEITLSSSEEAEITMAHLAENKFYAFEQNENLLIAYILGEDFDKNKVNSLLPLSADYTSSIIEDRNWNEEWESQLKPTVIDDFVGIRASFNEPLKNVQHEIIITPKMSFGTGHHATTRLMIKLMKDINFKNKSVLDFGTGTGLLAILAEKLGADSALAVDNDEWSINNAQENIQANNCKNIILEKRDNIIDLSFVDIILANINFNVLQENAENIFMISKKETILVISGFLTEDENEITAVFERNQFLKKNRVEKDGWLALKFENQ